MIFLLTFDTEEEKQKFSTLYKEYAEFMMRVARFYLPNSSDAEDIVQNAFLYIADRLEKNNISDRQKTRAYLALITKHKAIDHIRRTKREFPIDDFEKLENSLMANVRWGENEQLSRALLDLPDEYRSILELYYYHGYSYREIAVLLDQTVSAVSSKARRAKQRLAQIMNQTE